MSARDRNAEGGASLLEGLVSLGLTLLIIAAVLPLLSRAGRLQIEMAWATEHLQAARTATWRLQRDVRQAGFGCAGDLKSVSLSANGLVLELVHLEGGFGGGFVLEAGLKDQPQLSFSRHTGLRIGDQVLIRDRQGGRFLSFVEGIDRSRTQVRLADALPFPVGPVRGSRLYRVKRESWQLQRSELRRNGQLLVSGVLDGRFQSSSHSMGPDGGSLPPLSHAGLPPHGLLGLRWKMPVVRPGTPWAVARRAHLFVPAWRVPEMREEIVLSGSPLP